MNTEDNSKKITDKDEALDFLLEEKRDRERKAEWSKKYSGVLTKKKVIPLKNRILAISGIAASLLIIAMIFFNNKSDSDPVLMANRLTENIEIETSSFTRGVSDTNDKTVMIVDALKNSAYQEALSLLESRPAKKTIEEKYLTLIALVKTESPNDLILKMTNDIMATDNQYRAESLWVRALTKVKMKDFDSAKADLNALLKFKYKTKETKQLLESMGQD